ncbi:class I SAM-dependent methyltransferase [Pseudomonas parafulva]|uniref:class I SAM-dependent methyltransferase n=1 Tax=Pseudomonas parafulva TaxID=157782 RepID=UPI0018D985F8|nr:class I SAM-dependent methyltransferase [Pseudomonas parafulva]MBH3345533.1 class I SAM-dependent methyltransferase [Pseudomonas parafulva]
MIGKLIDLYRNHQGLVSDKWSSYLPAYHKAFSSFTRKKISLLEIGIQNGGSLEIWAKYFPRAELILGCDINEECEKLTFESPLISVVIGDITKATTLHSILAFSTSGFDIVIDDGSHFSQDIINAFLLLFPNIKPGGIFIAEDLHCSYWRDFNGGISNAASSMNFFKAISDVINFEHWQTTCSRSEHMKSLFPMYDFSLISEFELLLSSVHSIEFFNSMCFIRKSDEHINCLGPRVITGRFETVCPVLEKDGTFIRE